MIFEASGSIFEVGIWLPGTGWPVVGS